MLTRARPGMKKNDFILIGGTTSALKFISKSGVAPPPMGEDD